ncbi:pyruvate dehydrogenase complex dihydrolipoamide acetyltransferase [Acidocella sp. KAb 2-4]|uniref:pyruvate dehydrogenase complex dihydrolipoamide acetyltransferase n=1 Tax=Acidocella sp. KAb 2-4 TaxID=2885158 RepID=UPI001D08BAF9|nr:pyruvate dehydrogenase complex dihydrolipoamide acetyltransferase [Acidocella sp. KAb 2-4]MCB5945428.1 pyruvate dehydrogenase complex dihydrolipoamide acetyltransferase [Acidocella sp. KAb 2-4]
MAINILMPALSPTMTEGKLAKWLKAEGDEVKSGDIIAEIETDKATMEVEAVDEGYLAKIVVPEGSEGVAVNAVIGILTATKGEAVTAPAAAAPAPVAAAPAPAAALAPAPTAASPAAAQGERVFASPLAKRIAKQAGIDLASVKGSGPGGRIVKGDLDGAPAHAPVASPAPAAAPAPVAAPAPKPAAPAPAIAAPHKAIPHSTMRKVIARRLTESKQSVPHFYLNLDIELDALLKLRAELNAKSPKEGAGAFKLSVNDLIIKACGVALKRHPGVNASWTDEAIVQYDEVDISVAVAIPDGLITPIVKGADRLGLAAISNAMKDLAARAKAGKLKPEEFQGGGFSISNLGMFGISSFSAIINPPQAAILAVGAGEKRAVVKGDAIVAATVMTATLSVDHRVIDGALGAEFLATLKKLIEEPLSLLL